MFIQFYTIMNRSYNTCHNEYSTLNIQNITQEMILLIEYD